MVRNDKLLAMVLTSILTLNFTSIWAQTFEPSADSVQQERLTVTFDVLLNSAISPFIGSIARNPRNGLQMRFNVKNHALRLGIENRKQGSESGFSYRQVISASDSSVTYNNRNVFVNYLNFFVGYEYFRKKSWGNIVFGGDFGLINFQSKYTNSTLVYKLPTDSTYARMTGFGQGYQQVQDYGVVLKPFIGLRIPINHKLDFGAIFRTDLQFKSVRSFEMLENNVINIGSPQFSFRTLPFIDLRLSYTFGNGRK